MKTITRTLGSILLVFHGLIHLMGMAVYLQLTEIEGLAYQTALVNGRWDVGVGGIAFFGVLWAAAGGGFITAGVIWLVRKTAPRILLVGTSLFSLVLTLLDFDRAYTGSLVSGVIFILLLLKPWLEKPELPSAEPK